MSTTDAWLDALRASSRRLHASVARLPEPLLDRPAFPRGWTIARVLSHLGSGAEICTTLLQRGIAGSTEGPATDWLHSIWQRWDALPGPAQRTAWQQADERHLALLASLDARQRESVQVPYFTGPLSVDSYAGYRLSEQSVHTWDVQVALDENATIPAPEVALLWERLDLVATRFRHADTLLRLGPSQITLRLTEPKRILSLHLDAELHLYPCEALEPSSEVVGPAEAVLRLVYGRHRPADEVQVSGEATLADLAELFPGY